MAVIESVNAALEGKATLQDVNRALQDSGGPICTSITPRFHDTPRT